MFSFGQFLIYLYLVWRCSSLTQFKVTHEKRYKNPKKNVSLSFFLLKQRYSTVQWLKSCFFNYSRVINCFYLFLKSQSFKTNQPSVDRRRARDDEQSCFSWAADFSRFVSLVRSTLLNYELRLKVWLSSCFEARKFHARADWWVSWKFKNQCKCSKIGDKQTSKYLILNSWLNLNFLVQVH